MRTNRLLAVLTTMQVLFWGPGPALRPAEEGIKSEEPAAARKEKLKERDRFDEETAKLRAEGKIQEAIETCGKMLAIEREVFGDLHEDVAYSYDQLAQMREELGEIDAARKCLEEALRIQMKLHGEKDWRATDARLEIEDFERRRRMTEEERGQLQEADRWSSQVEALYQQGKPKEALPLARKQAEIRERIQGKRHRHHAKTLNDMALLYDAMGDYSRAESLMRQALEITEPIYGENHPNYAANLDNLAALYLAMGEYLRAEPLMRKALEITRAILWEDSSDHATRLNNLAALYLAMADYPRAEPLFRRAVEVMKKALGEDHKDTAAALQNLATLYQTMGDCSRAEPLYKQALEIMKKVLGGDHPDYALCLDNLALVYRSMGDYPRAEHLYGQALEIRKNALGEEHPHYAASLIGLGMVCKDLGDDSRAEQLYRQALKINEKALGEEHPGYAANLDNLGTLYHDMGDDPRALSFCRQALEIRKKALGEDHPGLAQSLYNLSAIYHAMEDYAHAEPLSRQSLQIIRKNMDLASSTQSERQQLAMTREFRRYLDNYLALTIAWKGSTKEEIYHRALSWKGAVFSRQSRLRLLRAEPELAPLFSKLESASSRLAALVFSRPDPAKKDIWSRQIAELTNRKEEIEKDLSTKSAGFRRAEELSRLSPRDIQSMLPENAALVDFFEYTLAKRRGLIAFVVRRQEPVIQIGLGPMKPIEEAIDAWRSGVAADLGSKEGGEAAARLRKALWEPIEKHLGDARLILASPDGALGRFPLSALPGSRPGTYLIEEYSFALVPVPQLLPEVLAEMKPAGAKPSLLLVGDVDFGGEPLDMAQAATLGGRLLHFRPLEFTRGEILMVADTFEEAHQGAGLVKLRGKAATESAFREAAPKNQSIHLATHGFFAPEELKSALEPSKKELAGEAFQDLGPAGDITGWHPGLLSGIVLAGANRKAEADADDGILTAVEVAGMDLSRTELLVLSACETGLGATAGGEGILGLQRASQVAGARTAIASLWKVDDQDAQALMARFYENLWKKKMGKLEALREAQLALLRGAVDRGPGAVKDRKDGEALRAPARAWAAWVLSGDWR